jgi:hypothetical protein
MTNGEISEIMKEIKEKNKLKEIYNELQDARIEIMLLSVDKNGDVYVEYVKYYKKQFDNRMVI